MRIALDPVPIVLGVYAYVGELLTRAAEKREGGDAASLAQRFARQRGSAGDREVQRLVRTLHADVKAADKLLRKTGDVWKISQETDLVELVVEPRAAENGPKAYVLLQLGQIRGVLAAIAEAARAAAEDETAVQAITEGAETLEGRSGDYFVLGFDPWGQ
jgi:hypothetical protein